MSALQQLRKAGIYLDTKKTALIVGKGCDWVRKNAHRFGTTQDQDYIKTGPKGKLYRFELSAVLKVAAELKDEFKVLRYQEAS